MPVSRADWRSHLHDADEMERAAQLISLMEELLDEMHGMEHYCLLIARTLKRRYPRHRRVFSITNNLAKEMELSFLALTDVKNSYKNAVRDFEHQFGKLTPKRFPTLTPIVACFEELLTEEQEDELVEDFLDG